VDAEQHCTNVAATCTGPTVRIAYGQTMLATKRATIPLSKELSSSATTGHIFSDVKSGSLVSIGQLCDDNCTALFKKSNVSIIKNGIVIIKGPRNQTNRLWSILLNNSIRETTTNPTSKIHVANGVIQATKTKSEYAAFLHGCAFSPVTSTFL
jgi:hypothetical protein